MAEALFQRPFGSQRWKRFRQPAPPPDSGLRRGPFQASATPRFRRWKEHPAAGSWWRSPPRGEWVSGIEERQGEPSSKMLSFHTLIHDLSSLLSPNPNQGTEVCPTCPRSDQSGWPPRSLPQALRAAGRHAFPAAGLFLSFGPPSAEPLTGAFQVPARTS